MVSPWVDPILETRKSALTLTAAPPSTLPTSIIAIVGFGTAPTLIAVADNIATVFAARANVLQQAALLPYSSAAALPVGVPVVVRSDLPSGAPSVPASLAALYVATLREGAPCH